MNISNQLCRNSFHFSNIDKKEINFLTLVKKQNNIINRDELFSLSAQERKQLAVDLLNSIDEEIVNQISDWKKELIKDWLQYNNQHSATGIEWKERKKKYE